MDKITEIFLGKNGSVVHLQLISGRKDPSKRRVVTLVRREVRLIVRCSMVIDKPECATMFDDVSCSAKIVAEVEGGSIV